MPARTLCSIALVLATLSCKPSAQRLEEEAEAGASWAATAEFAATAWTQNRVPVRFAERTLEEAREQLHATVRQAAGLDSQVSSADMVESLSRAEEAVLRLADAVQRRSEDDALSRIDDVSRARQALEQLHRKLERVSP